MTNNNEVCMVNHGDGVPCPGHPSLENNEGKLYTCDIRDCEYPMLHPKGHPHNTGGVVMKELEDILKDYEVFEHYSCDNSCTGKARDTLLFEAIQELLKQAEQKGWELACISLKTGEWQQKHELELKQEYQRGQRDMLDETPRLVRFWADVKRAELDKQGHEDVST